MASRKRLELERHDAVAIREIVVVEHASARRRPVR
jgi:hypothetical protein